MINDLKQTSKMPNAQTNNLANIHILEIGNVTELTFGSGGNHHERYIYMDECCTILKK